MTDASCQQPWTRLRSWALRHRTLLFASVVLIGRLAYLRWLCPYQLAADEAQYWDWSRRLQASYFTKGPGVAWLIAASTALLGVSEWAVRLPAAIATWIGTMAIGRLARRWSGGDERVGLAAAVLFTFTPVFWSVAQFMTIDAPYLACWLLACMLTWDAWHATTHHKLWLCGLLGAVLALGFLFKYTTLLLVPGIIFVWCSAQQSDGHRQSPLGLLVAGLVFLVGISPVLAWNHRHGWPTVAHLWGHVYRAGQELVPPRSRGYNPLWTLAYIFSPLVCLGPPLTFLTIFALRQARPFSCRSLAAPGSIRFVLWLALPVLAFYFLVSLKTDIELNWSAAGLAVLLLPAAYQATAVPASAVTRRLWRWTLAYGAFCALALAFGRAPLEALRPVRVAGYRLPVQSVLRRISGHREHAGRVTRLARQMEAELGCRPFIVGNNYARAALLAFYLEGHPVVYCASRYLGDGWSSYDFLPDTDLGNPQLLERPAILTGSTYERWRRALLFDEIRRTPLPGRVFVAFRYQGPAESP